MESQTASKRNRFACRSPIDRSCKRVKLCETPTTDSDASFSSDDDSPLQTPHLFEALPADLLGTILFSGYVDSLEIIHKTSCISKEAMELARSQVKMLDLRMCVKLQSSNLSFLIERFPMLEVLDLGYCTGIKTIYKLRKLANLKTLKLGGTRVSTNGIDPYLRSSATWGLQELDLSVINATQKTCIEDHTIKLLAERCKNLKSLKLAWCRKITDAAVVHLSGLRGLVELDLQLTSITADSCKILSKFGALERLDLSACDIGSRGLALLLPEGSVSSLKEFELRFNINIDETTWSLLLTRAPKLTYLNVQCCELPRSSIKNVFIPLQRRGTIVKMDRKVPDDDSET